MAGRLRVALAGAGMVSRHHLIAWSKLADAEVVAIADPNRAKAEERARAFGVPQVFDDVAVMIDATAPDAIDIATPVSTHAELVRLAASRGVAVLCQKPLTPTLAEAQALAAEIGGRVPVMAHENWRFRTPYRMARDWIANGRIGSVRRFAVAAESAGLVPTVAGDVPPALVRQPFMAHLPRFIIFELLIHHLDVARALCGDLAVAAARIGRTSPLVKGEDHAVILLDGQGSFGTVTGDFAVPGRSPTLTDQVDIVGETGRVSFDGVTLALWSRHGVAEERRFDPEAAYQSGYDAAIAHFVERCRTARPFETSLDDNLKTLRLVEDSYLLAERG
jgi:D-apiose dehydrogenase